MAHCQCEGIERCFGTERVAQELANYRKRGAAKTTRLLNVWCEIISGFYQSSRSV